MDEDIQESQSLIEELIDCGHLLEENLLFIEQINSALEFIETIIDPELISYWQANFVEIYERYREAIKIDLNLLKENSDALKKSVIDGIGNFNSIVKDLKVEDQIQQVLELPESLLDAEELNLLQFAKIKIQAMSLNHFLETLPLRITDLCRLIDEVPKIEGSIEISALPTKVLVEKIKETYPLGQRVLYQKSLSFFQQNSLIEALRQRVSATLEKKGNCDEEEAVVTAVLRENLRPLNLNAAFFKPGCTPLAEASLELTQDSPQNMLWY